MTDVLKHRIEKVALEVVAPKDLAAVGPEVLDRLQGLDLCLVDCLEEWTEGQGEVGAEHAGYEAVVALVALSQRFLHEMPSPLASRVLLLARTFNRMRSEREVKGDAG